MTTDISIATDPALAAKCVDGYLGILHRYLRADGGVLQLEADNKITSEGTSYLGDFAVSMRDRSTLDTVEGFRRTVLRRSNWVPGSGQSNQQWRANTANDPRIYGPALHAWDYRVSAFNGQSPNTVSDWNWATDAEVDIFKYLWKASWVWPDGPYLARALEILADLKRYAFVPYAGLQLLTTDEFQTRVTLTNGTPQSFTVVGPGHHLFSGRWQAEINPSYISDLDFYLAAYQATNDSFWVDAYQGAKAFLEQCTTPDGTLPTSAGLSPDWAGADQNGDAYAIVGGQRGWDSGATRSTDHKYDAFRTDHRLARHVRNYQSGESLLTLLADHYKSEWAANGHIAAEQSHAGAPLSGGYEKAMMTFGAVHVIEAVYGKTDTTAVAMRSSKLAVTDRQGTTGGYKYWNDYTGSPASYFTDMWMQYAYMADAGLLVNYGQMVAGSDQLGGELIDQGTSQDVLEGGLTTDVPPQPPAVGGQECEQWYWVNPRTGRTFDLSRFVDGVEAMAAIEGRGEPSLRQVTTVVPGLAGQVTTDIQHGPREIRFPLHATGRRLDSLGVLPAYADPEVLENVLVDLVKSMDPVGDGRDTDSGVGILRLIRRSGAVFDLYARVVNGLQIRQATHHLGVEQIDLAILADDPYWYSESTTLPFYGAEPRAWFPMIREGEPWLSSSAILGNADFMVDTDAPVDPVWTAVGPGATPLITNRDDPTQTIQFIDSTPELGAGEVLQIDTREGTVTGPGGADWFRYLKPGSRNMFQLPAGMAHVTLDLVGATDDSYIAVSYRLKQVIPR